MITILRLTSVLSLFLLFSCTPKKKETTAIEPEQQAVPVVQDISEPRFNITTDLLLGHFDCKTDVDDLHTVAAFATLLNHEKFTGINYHAVAGTYGIQDGLYVPGNELFTLAFGEKWSDAHTNFDKALIEVFGKTESILANGGEIWIMEAGQSDFSAALVDKIQSNNGAINTNQRIHIVQHSDWNENTTTPESLQFVKDNTTYHKIPDGNETGNGTPGFRSEAVVNWQSKIDDTGLIDIWNLAILLGNKYNGQEERYNNEAIAKGGLDFSDLSEACWILGMEALLDANDFFEQFSTVSTQ